jgi:hypothetical protein
MLPSEFVSNPASEWAGQGNPRPTARVPYEPYSPVPVRPCVTVILPGVSQMKYHVRDDYYDNQDFHITLGFLLAVPFLNSGILPIRLGVLLFLPLLYPGERRPVFSAENLLDYCEFRPEYARALILPSNRFLPAARVA